MPRHAAACSGLCALTACLGLLVLLFKSATVVDVGYVGVVTFVGHVSPEPLAPGFTFVNPFASVEKLNTQTQIFHFADYVPTMEGVNVYLEASVLVHLEGTHAVGVYTRVGTSYTSVILQPQFQSVVREVTSDHTAAALYTAEARQNMTTGLKDQLQAMTAEFGLKIESTPINKLTLPKTISDAIEKKMTLQQEAESMEYVLDQERQEAQRKVIEAQGIANYQNIISGNTTDGMLRWSAIQVTQKLSESCNAKIVFLGDSGLPIIHSKKPVNDTTPAGKEPNSTQLAALPDNPDSFNKPSTTVRMAVRQKLQEVHVEEQVPRRTLGEAARAEVLDPRLQHHRRQQHPR
eukprot:TRINITY_DN3518_c0_g1_i1.p1 TRINITY_DN3518_c0_g1~~TRINITY_DN3518_c0_g1_i1.p1  ORF type:complete len:348 (+),score=127.79 TRINITY_DN3518_c0_g1_i1:117-1160(+)